MKDHTIQWHWQSTLVLFSILLGYILLSLRSLSSHVTSLLACLCHVTCDPLPCYGKPTGPEYKTTRGKDGGLRSSKS